MASSPPPCFALITPSRGRKNSSAAEQRPATDQMSLPGLRGPKEGNETQILTDDVVVVFGEVCYNILGATRDFISPLPLWQTGITDSLHTKGLIGHLSMFLNKSKSSGHDKVLPSAEQQMKINEVRNLIGPLSNKLPSLCTDASITRYLKARNWNTKKASKMLKDTLEWRLEYKPEAIRWEEISHEAKTGKIYRADYLDKFGRPVLVMRPGFQNTNSAKGQIKYLVYCLENAVFNLAEGQEQMVWLIDFQGWSMASVSVKVTRETAHVLQDHYPERLGLGIFYNPPMLFESFWKIVKPFLDPKTYKKVKFVYSDKPDSQKIMEELFDMDKLESAFGGRNPIEFDYKKFQERMQEDDRKMSAFLASRNLTLPHNQQNVSSTKLVDSSVSVPQPSTSAHQGQGTDSDGSDEASSSTEDSSPESSVIDEITEDQKGDNVDGAISMENEATNYH
ncbi:hypothetical protein Taro_034742 [Colocasia esculenta]|uniref:CRAL-TRIO domain-containing protein n=1 Tax=Colocasia esculenta TaxID=4460 RepID=A0A843VX70_COLES|nr:hypothetical protein [Colocasia esculenta]